MPDGDGDEPRGRAGEVIDPVELASAVFDLLHEWASSANPIANIAANHLLPDQSFFDRVAAEMNISGANFRLFKRNKLLRELAEDIKANGAIEIAKQLEQEIAVHASRHSKLELSKNSYPPDTRQ